MRSAKHSQSATSLPRAPRDAADARIRNYAITMGIRTLCFILMVVVTPYSWYTWVFAGAAVVLPYVAVVFSNNAAAERGDIVTPDRELTAGTEPVTADPPATTIVIAESPPSAGTVEGPDDAR